MNLLIATPLVLLALAGCGGGSNGSGGGGGGIVGQGFSGRVDGGGPQNPISGSTVTLYAISSLGYGHSSNSLTTTTSSSKGAFTFGLHECTPDNPQTFVLITGGDAGGGTNSAIGMIALTGPCNSLSASTFVTVNELTTVAAEWALAQFIGSNGKDIGASSTNSAGLTNAVNQSITNLVVGSLSSGGNPFNTGIPAPFWANSGATEANCTGGSPPVNCDGLERMNTLANIAAACINSSGPSSTQCQQLFCGATPGLTWNGTTCSQTPTIFDTLAAIHSIVTNPQSNVATIFGVTPPPGVTQFTPVLSTEPDGWELGLNFTPSGANFNAPDGMAIDAAGQVWVTNNSNNTVTALKNDGSLAGNFAPAGANFNGPDGVAIDAAGQVWVTNELGNSVTALKNDGTLAGNFAPAGANFNTLGGVAIDTAGQVWVVNQQGNSVTALHNDGTLVGNFAPPGSNFTAPTFVAIDAAGQVWVPNGFGGNSVTALKNNGTLFGNFAPAGADFNNPFGLAIDAANQVWVTNNDGNSVTGLKNDGTLFGNFAPSGAIFKLPLSLAIDDAGDIWVANEADSVSALIGVARPVLTPLVACLTQPSPSAVCLP